MGFYKILFYGGIGCAIIFLILTIVLFFVLKIPAVFGNLSGSTQRKRIEEIRKTGYETVSKTKAIHDSTSKITVREAEIKTADSGKLEEPKKESKKDKKYTPRPDVGFTKVNEEIETEVLGYNEYKLGGEAAPKARPTAEDLDIENTEVLREGEEASSDNPDEESTDVLRNYPSGLGTDSFETSNEEETAILGADVEDDELFDDDLDEDVTDVLSNMNIEVEEKNAGKDSPKDMAVEITGKVGEDITSVLTSHDRTDIVNDMGSDIGNTAEMNSDDDETDYSDQITVIYSATVVNTSESLDD